MSRTDRRPSHQRLAGPGIRRADRLRRACRVAAAGRMTGRLEHFDARSGGSYRLVLVYAHTSAISPQRQLRRHEPELHRVQPDRTNVTKPTVPTS